MYQIFVKVLPIHGLNNNVLSIYQIFVKLLPITGLKESMLLMTNDNLLYL
jgi:hypothetical protein